MKKLATLLLAAGLVFCGVTGASAIDFKAKGQWIMSFDYGSGGQGASEVGNKDVYGFGNAGGGSRGPDNFNATQRVRLQIDAIASESLSGTVYFEIGDTKWGQNSSGGALGADQKIIELKQAYIDWIIPHTDTKIRMGIQNIALPSFTADTQVFANDTAGIVVSNKFNDNVGLTVFWARAYNDNYTNDYQDMFGYNNDSDNYLDNVDVFGAALPLTFDGFKVIPWVTYAMVGQNFARHSNAMGNSIGDVAYGLLPVDAISRSGIATPYTNGKDDLLAYGDVWHAGITGEITAADPFRIAWDVNYGNAYFGTMDHGWNAALGQRNKEYELKREGFYASLLFEYKMDWGTPGLYGWYSSGDDDDPYNGSERMPSISTLNATNGFSNFAGTGNAYIAREGIMGLNLIGTWGIGARIKDLSFVEDLKHTFRVNYFQGTNSTNMAGVIRDGGPQYYNDGFYSGTNGNGMYLTTNDHAFEFGLTTDYKIYENLTLQVDAAYLAFNFDQDSEVWGSNFTLTDAWNVNASFVYSF